MWHEQRVINNIASNSMCEKSLLKILALTVGISCLLAKYHLAKQMDINPAIYTGIPTGSVACSTSFCHGMETLPVTNLW